MAASRVLYPPIGARNLRHWKDQIRIGEQTYQRAKGEAEQAHAAADRLLAQAHRLDCEAWSALQFIGGDDDPSPSIADAIHGGCELLEVDCPHCHHGELVDLVEVTLASWPREKPVHTLAAVLFCRPCLQTTGLKRRPNLVGLRVRQQPAPSAPAAARRAK